MREFCFGFTNLLVITVNVLHRGNKGYSIDFSEHWRNPHDVEDKVLDSGWLSFFIIKGFRTIVFIFIVIYNRDIGPAVRVFANGPGDLGSIPGRVIPKDFKNGT